MAGSQKCYTYVRYDPALVAERPIYPMKRVFIPDEIDIEDVRTDPQTRITFNLNDSEVECDYALATNRRNFTWFEDELPASFNNIIDWDRRYSPPGFLPRNTHFSPMERLGHWESYPGPSCSRFNFYTSIATIGEKRVLCVTTYIGKTAMTNICRRAAHTYEEGAITMYYWPLIFGRKGRRKSLTTRSKFVWLHKDAIPDDYFVCEMLNAGWELVEKKMKELGITETFFEYGNLNRHLHPGKHAGTENAFSPL